MKEKLKNQDRFDILRGYYKNGKFHPKGKEGVDMDKLLHQMEFGGWTDFLIWYKSLTPNDIKSGQKDWCPGDCCQSILSKLLEMEKIKELTIKMLEEENKNKISPDTDLVISDPMPVTFWERLRERIRRLLP